MNLLSSKLGLASNKKMKTQRIFVLIILFLVMLFMSVGCQTISPAQRTEKSKIEQTIDHYAAPDGAEGIACYYAKRYHGRRTSSGEIYSPQKLTAAHPSLPLGTRVKVVNLANGKSVIVTVNDRCREHEEVFIDLSRKAARQLGMIGQGKANVRIIIVENDNPSDEILTSTQK
jgi:rare lipoprotein A